MCLLTYKIIYNEDQTNMELIVVSNYFDFPEVEVEEIKLEEFPIKPKRRGVKEKYPFSKAKIGQGFKIPDGVSVESMRCLAYQRGKALGFTFQVSSYDRTVVRIA